MAIPKLNDEKELKAMIWESDEYKMWKSIPKKQRERLTTKQMMRVMKPDILAEGLALEVNKPKTQVKKIVTVETQIEETEKVSTKK
jgi:hypothetical protein